MSPGQRTAPGRRGHLQLVHPMRVPAAMIRTGALEPVLDVRAETLAQHEALVGFVEPITALARTATPEQRRHLRAIVDNVRAIAERNTRVGERSARAAGVLDGLTADLRRAETAGHGAPSTRELANRLRGPLGALSRPHACDPRHIAAVRELHDIARSVPAGHLTANASLRHELGVAKYTTLTALVRSAEGPAR